MPQEPRDINTLYSLEYDNKTLTATVIWREQLTSSELRAISERLIEFAETHTVVKMIHAVYYAHVITPEDQDWLAGSVAPRLRTAGLCYSAIVLPQNLATERTIVQVVEKTNTEKTNSRITDKQYFSTLVRAQDWLNHV